MALKVNLFYLDVSQNPRIFHSHSFPCNRARTRIQCSKNDKSDGGLALELAKEVARMNRVMVQREEAMEKSREVLYREVCEYLNLKAEEVKKKWEKMNEEDKLVLVKGFVSEWSSTFHPLSARSVKELVDEYLLAQHPSPSSSSSSLFPTLKKIMGFSQNQ